MIGAAHPRVLVHGLTDAEYDAIAPLAGSVAVIDDLAAVHPEEHDVLVQTDADFNDYGHIFNRRIVFATAPTPDETLRAKSASASSVGPTTTRSKTQFVPARNFDVTDFAKQQKLESLVRRSCIPAPNARYTGFETPVFPHRSTNVFVFERLNRPLVSCF